MRSEVLEPGLTGHVLARPATPRVTLDKLPLFGLSFPICQVGKAACPLPTGSQNSKKIIRKQTSCDQKCDRARSCLSHLGSTGGKKVPRSRGLVLWRAPRQKPEKEGQLPEGQESKRGSRLQSRTRGLCPYGSTTLEAWRTGCFFSLPGSCSPALRPAFSERLLSYNINSPMLGV